MATRIEFDVDEHTALALEMMLLQARRAHPQGCTAHWTLNDLAQSLIESVASDDLLAHAPAGVQ